MKEPLNLMLTGVGGQGNILASEVIATAALMAGYQVTVGETYGGTQRGGAVSSHIRLSKAFQFGPLIPKKQANVIIGFEPLETYRVVREYANKDTVVVLNNRPTYPLGVLKREYQYPDVKDLVTSIEMVAGQTYFIDATELAQKAGDAKTQNIVMIGCLASLSIMLIDFNIFQNALEKVIPVTKLQINLKAFESGLKALD